MSPIDDLSLPSALKRSFSQTLSWPLPISVTMRNGLLLLLLFTTTAFFWQPLSALYRLTQEQSHYSHLLLVPLVSLYVFYLNRQVILASGKWSPVLGLIVVGLGTAAYAVAAHRASSTVPVVMWTGGYPVEAGIADSLAHPGKNVTGASIYAGTGIWGKLVELLSVTKPGIKRVGVLWDYLPPAFPAIRIDGELYWDGGILSNTPAECIFSDKPRHNSLIFAVHLWNPTGPEPETIWQILHRQKDIQYSSRVASHIARQRNPVSRLQPDLRPRLAGAAPRPPGRQGRRLGGLHRFRLDRLPARHFRPR